MGFITELSTNTYRGEKFILTSPLIYKTKTGKEITVESGTITNFASIPAPLRIFFSVNGKHRKAATLHDYLYEKQRLTRKQCDELFLEAMKSCGVGYFKRYSMYWGVRSGGWVSWNKCKDKLEELKEKGVIDVKHDFKK